MVEKAGTTTQLGYTRLARYESESRPGKFYWVSEKDGGTRGRTGG